MEIWEPKPPGTLWATPGLLRDSFTFTYILYSINLFRLNFSPPAYMTIGNWTRVYVKPFIWNYPETPS